MAIYNVVMGQGISVENLGADTLVTGPGDAGDAIQSCSAVIFFNSTTDAAGLFHFPAGDVKKDGHSRQALVAILKKVQPTEAYILYGVASDMFGGPRKEVPDDYGDNLRTFVLSLLSTTCLLRRRPATNGVASISQANHVATIGLTTPNDYTDLRRTLKGKYDQYTLYGKGAARA